MVYHRWQIKQSDQATVQQLSKELNAPNVLCQLLASRGITDAQQAHSLVDCNEKLSSPMLLTDMERAVQRIHDAIDSDEKIAVFGDYDVDGVSSTALLFTYLDSVGAEVYFKLPNRDDDGYGLSKGAIDLMNRRGISLIITVDNGISAFDEIDYANSIGIDVIVTDHHLPQGRLPNALAVIDPLRDDDTSPAKNLSGVGVAFKLICAIESCECEELLPFYGDFVAIGTIADIMQLTGENRTIVKAGIDSLQNTERVGIRALLEISGLAGKQITAENVSFGLSPRLNAAGRMDDATAALQLLLCDDEEEAHQLANLLNEQNAQRQTTEQEIIEEIAAQISQNPELQQNRVMVVWGKNYHAGVLGIVASRVLERFGKPTIILTYDDEGNAKGSGRSFSGFNLHSAISACSSILERFGGHELAAGLSLKKDNLEALRIMINEYAGREYPVIKRPPISIDAVISLTGVTADDIDSLNLLAPFGSGNPAPLFLIENAVIEGVFPVSEGRHCRLRLKSGGQSFYAVMFGTSVQSLPYKQNDKVDAAVYLSVYESAQGRIISGRIKELKPSGLKDDYIDYVELYEGFAAGAQLSTAEKARLCPQRADVAAFYKLITENGLQASDLRPVFAQLGAENTGKILASADILLELSHIEKVNAGSSEKYVLASVTKKRPLTESTLLSALEE